MSVINCNNVFEKLAQSPDFTVYFQKVDVKFAFTPLAETAHPSLSD